MRKCVVCNERKQEPGGNFCEPCGVSYLKATWTLRGVTEWAAKRARYYERKRAKLEE